MSMHANINKSVEQTVLGEFPDTVLQVLYKNTHFRVISL